MKGKYLSSVKYVTYFSTREGEKKRKIKNKVAVSMALSSVRQP